MNEIEKNVLVCTNCYHEFRVYVGESELINTESSLHACHKCGKVLTFPHIQNKKKSDIVVDNKDGILNIGIDIGNIANISENPNPDYIPPAFKRSKEYKNIKKEDEKMKEKVDNTSHRIYNIIDNIEKFTKGNFNSFESAIQELNHLRYRTDNIDDDLKILLDKCNDLIDSKNLSSYITIKVNALRDILYTELNDVIYNSYHAIDLFTVKYTELLNKDYDDRYEIIDNKDKNDNDSEISKDKTISELSYALSETVKENRQLKTTLSNKFIELNKLRDENLELKSIINNMNKEGE